MFLCVLELNWISSDSGGNEILEILQTSYKIAKDLVSNPSHNLIDVELTGSEESNISANLNETSISSGQTILIPQDILKNIHLKNFNRVFFVHLNIYSVQREFNADVDGFLSVH